MKKSILFVGLSVLALSACSNNKEYHYWQKADPENALYMTGVKAQQMLEQDIGFCVHQIIEMSKLADVRGKVPPSFSETGSYDQKQAKDELSHLPYWDVPEYIRNIRVDHTDFHDFDGCMAWKGWERVKYVSPDTERRSKEIYDGTADYSVRPKNPRSASYEDEMKALHKAR